MDIGTIGRRWWFARNSHSILPARSLPLRTKLDLVYGLLLTAARLDLQAASRPPLGLLGLLGTMSRKSHKDYSTKF